MTYLFSSGFIHWDTVKVKGIIKYETEQGADYEGDVQGVL